MATLKVKNETAAELAIPTGDGPVKIAAGAVADLTEKQLISKGFSDAVNAGSVSFVSVAKPSQETVELARKVLPAILSAKGTRIGSVKSRFEQSQGNLLEQRETYNKSWGVGESHFLVAQASTAGWPAIKAGVKNLLLDTAVEDPAITDQKDAVADLEAEIEDLKIEDLAVSGRTREEWFADRVGKEALLAKAVEALDQLAAQKTDPIAVQIASIDGAVTALLALTKNNAIGQKIPEFGK